MMDSSRSSSTDAAPDDIRQSPYWPSISQSDQTLTSQNNESQKKRGNMGMLVGASFIVAEIAGAGLLNLPFAISNTGWSGIGLVILMGIAVTYSGTRLSRSWIIIEDLWPEYKQVDCRRAYQEIGFRAFGKKMQYLVEVSLQVNLLGACIVYIILIAELMEDFLDFVTKYESPLTSCELLLIITALIIPLTWLPSPKDIWWGSIIAVGTMLFTVCVVMYDLFEAPSHNKPTYDPPTFLGYFLSFGSILFSFGGASLFPSLQNDMKDRSSFTSSVIISFTFLTLLYCGVGGSVYYYLGSSVPENILEAVSGTAVAVADFLLASHFFFAFVITANPGLQSIEQLFGIKNKFGFGRVVTRSAVIMVLTIIGLSVPDFGKLLDLLGATSISLMSFIFPPIFYYRLSTMVDPATGEKYSCVSVVERVMLLLVLTLGVVGGSVSTYSAASAIIQGGALNSTCFSRESFLGV